MQLILDDNLLVNWEFMRQKAFWCIIISLLLAFCDGDDGFGRIILQNFSYHWCPLELFKCIRLEVTYYFSPDDLMMEFHTLFAH